MKAAVMYAPGGPDVLKLEDRPIPTAKPGQVLIRVKAFGLNRSELFTRQDILPASNFHAYWALKRQASSKRLPEESFRRGISLRP